MHTIIQLPGYRVKFYIWLPDETKPAQHYGHVALRTFGPNGIYASLWPERPSGYLWTGAEPKWIIRARKTCRGKFKTFEKAMIADNRLSKPITIDLYGLDVASINKTYQDLVQRQIRFLLWASGGVLHNNYMNCTGLIQHLLIAGDKTGFFKNQLPKLYILSPESLLDILKAMKAIEDTAKKLSFDDLIHGLFPSKTKLTEEQLTKSQISFLHAKTASMTKTQVIPKITALDLATQLLILAINGDESIGVKTICKNGKLNKEKEIKIIEILKEAINNSCKILLYYDMANAIKQKTSINICNTLQSHMLYQPKGLSFFKDILHIHFDLTIDIMSSLMKEFYLATLPEPKSSFR